MPLLGVEKLIENTMKKIEWFGFTKMSNVLVACEHSAVLTESGYIEHFIDGFLRATVPPEGQADYCAQYKELAELRVADAQVIQSVYLPPLPNIEPGMLQ